MKKFKLISLAILLVFGILITSCKDDDDNDIQTNNYKKISKIYKGADTSSLELNESFSWVGSNMTKEEEYSDGSVISSIVVKYSGDKITEIQNFADTSSSMLKKMIKPLNNYYTKIGKKELTQTQRLVIHRDESGKIDYIDVYAEMSTKDLPLLGYIQITYDGSNPIKNDMYIGTHAQSIIFRSTIATFQNENITSIVTKSNFKIMQMGVEMVTSDSTLYTFDDKINAFSSMKDRYPMIDAQIISKNNITREKKYDLLTYKSPSPNETTNTTYQYDDDNYPISATRTSNGNETEQITYTYL